ncbi:LacI family transcriptional regulator [Pantoea sp. Acro-805]|uniref:LacI family transcriptional regulator n=1 Tax=Candidatus Pantoea formicae TaxID=2608355 RepID=A0ABX0QYX7_9GAMM|nr:LacI family DNA-binding transcriptional regulator [Pantoea formicae]NIF00067.1 LacI family transcriptional regulator [Pantoea formicae]
MITMLDVARKAGVSKATVSRVLAGNRYVSKTTQQKVFQAIEETGYRPNLLARSLATQKSQNIGLIVTHSLFNGPYFSELLYQTATLTNNYGRQLILADGKTSADDERAAIEFLLDLRCDAIIIYPRFLDTDALEAIIEQHEVPIMVVNRQLQRHADHCVWATHQQNTVDAVSYLIERGHHDIAFITGLAGSPTAAARLAGYQQALTQHGLKVNPDLVIQGAWTPNSGQQAAQRLLESGTPFSAMMASNDDMAIGAALALNAAGKRLPQDVSLMGFDDIRMAEFFLPPLTTVHVPVAEMIQHTLAQLVAMLEGEEIAALPPFSGRLIERASVADGPFKS